MKKLKYLLIILGSVAWSLTMVKSGWLYDHGIGFWGPNGHDGVWHIALIKQLAKGNYVMPVFGGASLQNYHVGYDLLLALVNRYTGVRVSLLYFQIMPPVVALLTGILVYKFVLNWKKSEAKALWATFFVYFGGSFGWLVSLARGQGLSGESMFWSQQAISTLINPPFAVSLLLIMLGLILLSRYVKKPSTANLTLSILVFGVLVQVKAYAGVLALGGILVAGIWQLFIKKDWRFLYVFLGSLILSLAIFLPLNKSASGLLVWQPFWFLETMMGLSDRVGWIRYFSAMTTYRAGGVWYKMIPAYAIAFLIFWYGNLGTRLIKEYQVFKWLKNLKAISWYEAFVSSVIVAGFIIPTFFLQKGTPWNTIQFFYYSLFFSGILAGIGMPDVLANFKSLSAKYGVAVLIIVITLPTTIGTLKYIYLPERPPAILPNEELEALNFLSEQPDGVVLTYPFYRNPDEKLPEPVALYQYVSTSYVSAYSGQQVFLEDEINLDITGYDWKGRRREIEEFYNTLDHDLVWNYLRDNNITYVYWVKSQRSRLGEGQLGIERIFENESVNIYKVI